MKSITQKKRYLQHEVTTKLYAVRLYRQVQDVQYVCRRYHVSKASLMRWNRRYDGTRESLAPKSHRPKTPHPNAHTVLSRVMRKYNSVTYEVGKAKAEQAAGMFGLAAGQRAASCPSRVAKPLAKPLTGGWRSATYARSQQSAPCFSRSICSSDFMLM